MKLRRKLFLCFFVLSVVAGGLGFWLESHFEIPVVMYHQVADNPQGHNDTVSPESFRRQMEYLSRQGYRVVRLKDLVALLNAGKNLPRRTVVLTFDDGYDNAFFNAFPILQVYKFPATFFVSGDRIGKPRYMTWDQIYVLRDAGMDIQSHGMSEDYLPNVPEERQRYEIFESKKVLSKRLQKPIEYYAYSIGGFSPQITNLVIEAGYQGAVATNRGLSRRQDVFAIRRIKLSDKNNFDLILGFKLSGYYNAFRQIKKPY